MTAVQLRAELFREMSPLLDSESALEKMLAFVKTLLPAKKNKAGDGELTDDERLDAALQMFHSDWGGEGDAMEIAATALHEDLIVVTGNIDHFNRIPDLKTENWMI